MTLFLNWIQLRQGCIKGFNFVVVRTSEHTSNRKVRIVMWPKLRKINKMKEKEPHIFWVLVMGKRTALGEPFEYCREYLKLWEMGLPWWLRQ